MKLDSLVLRVQTDIDNNLETIGLHELRSILDGVVEEQAVFYECARRWAEEYDSRAGRDD